MYIHADGVRVSVCCQFVSIFSVRLLLSVLLRWAIPGPLTAERASKYRPCAFLIILQTADETGPEAIIQLTKMRIRTLILCLFLCVASAFAKDVITKTDGSKIDAKVEEITETVIKYRKATNPSGPVYTIPLSTVATIHYENGSVDKFSEKKSTSTNPPIHSSNLSDFELTRLYEEQNNTNKQGNVSDSQLINLYNDEIAIPQEVKSKVKSYRTIGWIGGGTLLAVGLVTGIILYHNEDYYDTCGIWIAAGAVAGGTWWYIYHRKAKNLIKKSKNLSSYSTDIIEKEIIQIGDNSLTAGINLMGNRITHSQSLGLSLGLTF